MLKVLALVFFVGCAVDAQEPTDPQQDDDTVSVPEELTLQPAAHSNCGHMTYCMKSGRPRYCAYNEKTTHCTPQNVNDDAFADCKAVCGGGSACFNLSITDC